MQFIFPSTIEPFLYAQNALKLSNLLRQFIIGQNLASFLNYRVTIYGKKYLYAKCTQCSAKLSYKFKEDGIFELRKVQREHQHRKGLLRRQAIKTALSQLPNCFPTKNLKEIIQNRFSISDSTFYRILNQVKNGPLSFHEIISSFNGSKLLGYFEPLDSDEKSLPSIFLITSQKAKAAYKKFGNVLSFDFTYNLFRQKSPQNKDYRLGVFGGLSGALKLLPFAFAIVDEETSQVITKMFYQFFKLLGGTPKIIITDEQASIKSGLDHLFYEDLWKGQHLLDSFHVLRNLKNKLRRKENIDVFSKLVFSKTNNEFLHHLSEAKRNFCQQDRRVLENFYEAQRQFVCFSQIQTQFIGFGVSSYVEKLNDLIKSQIPRSEYFLSVAKKLARFLEATLDKNLNECEFQSMRADQYLTVSELKKLRKSLSKKVFSKIVESVGESMTCTIQELQQNERYNIADQFGEETVELSDGKFICSCQYTEKSGLPCKHLIKLLILSSKPIQPYILSRWNCSGLVQRSSKPKISTRMPRLTKRNRRR